MAGMKKENSERVEEEEKREAAKPPHYRKTQAGRQNQEDPIKLKRKETKPEYF